MSGVTYALREYQRESIDRVLDASARGVRRQLGIAACGLGKAQPDSELVLTPDGWSTMGSLRRGDFVIGSSGHPVEVLDVFPQGIRPIVEVEFSDGARVRCDSEHLWAVRRQSDRFRGKPWRVAKISDLDVGRGWWVPLVRPVEFNEWPLPLDPYLLGVLLGDGGLSIRGQVRLHTERALAESLELPSDCHLHLYHENGPKAADYWIAGAIGRSTNSVMSAIRRLGLEGTTSHDKRVPHVYMFSSASARLDLLRGIMDADGHVRSRDNHVEITLANESLAEDVAALVRSLGGTARIHQKVTSWTHLGTRKTGTAWRLSIALDVCPFRWKADRWRPRTSYPPQRKITAITPLAPESCTCILVDAPDHLYVTRDYVLTHNTVVFVNLAREMGVRTLILAHRDELIEQAASRVREWWPDVDLGIVKAEQDGTDALVVVASVQTLCRPKRLARLLAPTLLGDAAGFGLVICDECFPAGTLVGDRPIESLRPGDVVPSWDETTGQPVERRVVRLMRRRALRLVTVRFADGESMTCTPNHPLMTTGGWSPAGLLDVGDDVLSFTHHAAADRDNVRRMRETCDHHDEAEARQLSAERSGVLLVGVPGRLGQQGQFATYGRDEQALRLGEDDGAQSNASARVRREDEGNAQIDGPQAARSGRQWMGSNRAASPTRRVAGLAHRGGRAYWAMRKRRTTDALQDRHRRSGIDGGSGDRRPIAFLGGPPRVRSTQGRVAHWRRVVGIEVLQPGSASGSGEDCTVYNLEVEGTHTYLVGSGVVAHNCHHAVAKSYQDVFHGLRCGEPDGPLLLGVTATADRGDGKGLDGVFDEIVFSYPLVWGITHDYLSDLRGLRVQLDVDLSGLRVRGGDYDAGQAGEMLAEADAPNLIARAWLEHARGRRTIVFTPTVATAHETAQAFTAAGVSAAAVDGGMAMDDRRRVLADYSAGRIEVVVNCAVLGEGFDEPRTDCVVVARPTKSRALYCFDSDTEVLTPDGWVPGRAIAEGDIIAAFDPADGAVQWELVLAHVERGLLPGERMMSLSSPTVSIRVTDTHRMVWRRRVGRSKAVGPWSVSLAGELAERRDLWQLPVAGVQKVEGIPLTDADLAFIGWVQTDGHVNKANGAIQIGQQYPEQRAHIEATLDACGFKWRVSERTEATALGPRRYPLATYRVSRGAPRGSDKHLTGWARLESWLPKASGHTAWTRLEGMDERQWAVLLDAWHRGDGSKQNGQQWTRRGYHLAVSDEWVAGWVQGMCMRRGWRANVIRSGSVWMVHCRRGIARVIGGQSSHDRPKLVETLVRPGERVWCVSVESGAILTRRFGRGAIMGQTQMVGRGSRKHPEKVDGLIVDVVGATDMHDLAVLPSLFGVERREAVWEAGESVTTALRAQVERHEREGRLVAVEARLFDRMRTTSRMAWVAGHDPGGSRRFELSLGRAGLLVLREGPGGWLAGYRDPDGTKTVLVHDASLEFAQGIAEDHCRRLGAQNVADLDAPWRNRHPSRKQRDLAVKLKVILPKGCTKGEASDLLGQALARKRASRAG
jgi:superfamily II DNA or RNA helicase